MPFDIKKWLDDFVVPLLQNASIHSFIWNGSPPHQILAWLLCDPPSHWPQFTKHLIDHGFRFDLLREPQKVNLQGASLVIFGGDGAPFISPSSLASVRLFSRVDDRELILEVGAKFDDHKLAVAAVKALFDSFADLSPLEVCAKFAAPFGAA